MIIRQFRSAARRHEEAAGKMADTVDDWSTQLDAVGERFMDAAEAHRRAMIAVEIAAVAAFFLLLGVAGSKWFQDTLWG